MLSYNNNKMSSSNFCRRIVFLVICVASISLLLLPRVSLLADTTNPPCTNETNSADGTVNCPASDPCPLLANNQCSGEHFAQLVATREKSHCVASAGSNYEAVNVDCTKKTVCMKVFRNGTNFCRPVGAESFVTVGQCRNLGADCSL